MSRHLDRFVEAARARAATLPDLPVSRAREHHSLRAALAGRDSVGVIAEFKRRSPSQGVLGGNADVAAYARDAGRLGAAALSVLTEPQFFDGGYADLAIARAVTEVPILAKDFIVDRRQIAAAACHGADAVLLILRCLSDAQVAELAAAAGQHGLEVVLECHDRDEVERALAVPQAIVGVNNRDLDTLDVDLGRARELLPRVPDDRVGIAESGYGNEEELRGLRGLANGALIGSSVMRGVDLGALVAGGKS